jgi:hypothetical protein
MPKRFPPYKLTVSGSIGKIVLDRPEKLDAAISGVGRLPPIWPMP